LLFDDGSTDNSLEICSYFASLDNRVRVVRAGPNVGLGAAMNALAAHARAPLFAVQEQDDRSRPDRLRLQTQAFEEVGDAVLVAGISSWRDDNWLEITRYPTMLDNGEEYPSSREALVRLLYVEGCLIENSTAMFRRDLFEGPCRLSFVESRLSSVDWEFFIQAAHRGRIIGLHDVLVEMARGSDHRITADSDRLFVEMLECIDHVMTRYGPDLGSPISPRLRRSARARVYARRARARGIRSGGFDLLRSFLLAPRMRRIRHGRAA
jgi:glycosyltransferase involved in cell wall biosynthesis